jgi:regulatory protein
MKITSIELQKRNHERVELYIDGEPRLVIAAEIAAREGLRPAMQIDEADLARLEAEDLYWRAKDIALRFLAYRSRSEFEVGQRLRRDSFPDHVIERCVAELRERQLLNDAEFAEAFTRDRIRFRPSGPIRLRSELRARGIVGEEAERSIAEIFSEDPHVEIELARRALQKFPARTGEDPIRTRRRVYGFLGRRGFSAETIARVTAEWDGSDPIDP